MLKKTCFEGIMKFQRFKTLYVPILRVHFEAPLKMIISNPNPQILQKKYYVEEGGAFSQIWALIVNPLSI